jgi:membrane associated rhomboid family serine protease
MPDLPRRRSSQGPVWLRRISGRLTTTIKTLVLINLAVYLFYVFARDYRPFFEMHLALGPRFFDGELWQPITSLFVHLDFIGFVLTTIGLWFVGVAIEQTRGPARTTALYFGAGVLSNLAIAGVWRLRGFGPVPFVDGCSFSALALFVAFARMFGRQPVQFWPTTLMVQARYMVLGMTGIAVLVVLAQGNIPWLAGIAVAVAVGYFGAGPGGLSALRTFFANARDVSRARRLRRRFGVIEGGDRPSKKYVN